MPLCLYIVPSSGCTYIECTTQFTGQTPTANCAFNQLEQYLFTIYIETLKETCLVYTTINVFTCLTDIYIYRQSQLFITMDVNAFATNHGSKKQVEL